MIKFATLALVIALAVCQNDDPNPVVTAVTITCVAGATPDNGTANTETCGKDVTGCHSPVKEANNEFTAYGCGPCPDETKDETCVECDGADCNTYTVPKISWECANSTSSFTTCEADEGTEVKCHGPPEAEEEEEASDDATDDTADDTANTDTANPDRKKRSTAAAGDYGCGPCADGVDATVCVPCDGDKCNGATAAAPLLAVLIGVLFWLQ